MSDMMQGMRGMGGGGQQQQQQGGRSYFGRLADRNYGFGGGGAQQQPTQTQATAQDLIKSFQAQPNYMETYNQFLPPQFFRNNQRGYFG